MSTRPWLAPSRQRTKSSLVRDAPVEEVRPVDRIITGVGVALSKTRIIAQEVYRPGPTASGYTIEDHIVGDIDVHPQVALANLFTRITTGHI